MKNPFSSDVLPYGIGSCIAAARMIPVPPRGTHRSLKARAAEPSWKARQRFYQIQRMTQGAEFT